MVHRALLPIFNGIGSIALSVLTTITLQRHLSVLTKSTHVESRFCGRSRQVKAAFCTPVNPCVRSVCSRSVVVGLYNIEVSLLLGFLQHAPRHLCYDGPPGASGRTFAVLPSLWDERVSWLSGGRMRRPVASAHCCRLSPVPSPHVPAHGPVADHAKISSLSTAQRFACFRSSRGLPYNLLRPH